jgi:hypothetical protein
VKRSRTGVAATLSKRKTAAVCTAAATSETDDGYWPSPPGMTIGMGAGAGAGAATGFRAAFLAAFFFGAAFVAAFFAAFFPDFLAAAFNVFFLRAGAARLTFAFFAFAFLRFFAM